MSTPTPHSLVRRLSALTLGRPTLLFGALFLLPLISALPVHAGDGSVDANGDISLNAHFRYPPSADDIDRVQEQFQRASTILCDATDGQMKISDVRITAGGANEGNGDLWIYPGRIGRASANGAPVHNGSKRIYITIAQMRADTMAHELGHLVFDLGDLYDEQRRLGTACGYGPSVDEPVLSESIHSIMQSSGRQVCVDGTGKPTRSACYNDSDCKVGETCPLPALMSELTTPWFTDLLRGDSALAVDTCPEPRAGNELTITGFVGENNALDALDLTSFDDARASVRGEQRVELLDSIGDVPGYYQKSSHALWIFPDRNGPQSWTLTIAIDGGELVGGTEGEVVVLDTVALQFDPLIQGGARALRQVNGDDLAAPGYTPPVIEVKHLANGADDVELTLLFDDFQETANRRGGFLAGSLITTDGEQQLAVCRHTTACEQLWNTRTERWEATVVSASKIRRGAQPLSDWEYLQENVQAFYDIDLAIPEGTPQVLPHAHCSDPVNFGVTVSGVDQVILAIDRSGSMREDRSYLNDTKTRLDWAKAAARAFVQLQDGSGVELGMISFDEQVSEDLDPEAIAQAPIGSEHLLADVHDTIEGIAPGGNTAIGDALVTAHGMLDGGPVASRSVFLLSDGEDNVSTVDPQDAADMLRADGVVVYTLPVGNAADGEILASIADTTGGEMLEADTSLEMIPRFAEVYAHLRGEVPVLSALELDVAGQPTIAWDWPGPGPHPAAETVTEKILVEPGAKRLNVLLSSRNDLLDTWDMGFHLWGPGGEELFFDDPSVIDDDYFRLARVEAPTPGIWHLQVYANNFRSQHAYLNAHVENSATDCAAAVSPFIVEGPDAGPVTLAASAGFLGPLGRGMVYEASILRPDGSTVALNLPVDEEHLAGGEVTFDDYAGHGVYEVVVTCQSNHGTYYTPGERADAESVAAQGRPAAFQRQVRTSFFLNDPGNLPSPPPGGDCDRDGIPDAWEGWGDKDGDGVPDACDEDIDNDDIPDDQAK